MRIREAKDFLAQQTAEQAALENVPLSDLEKRMMYFTETEECVLETIAIVLLPVLVLAFLEVYYGGFFRMQSSKIPGCIRRAPFECRHGFNAASLF